MKIIPSFPPFAFPTSSRHRRHPCPTSRALGADVIDAHGAPLPRSGRTNRKPNATRDASKRAPLAVALPGRRASTETFTRALNAAVLVAVTANILRSGRDCEWRMRRRGTRASMTGRSRCRGRGRSRIPRRIDPCVYHHHHPCRLLVNVCFGSTCVYNFYCMCSVGLGFREIYHARRVDL